jgi:hypothetical protein
MANITGIPEGADMSSYQFLSGNLPMLLVSLIGVFIGSSFAEELLYRGFLTSRIEELLGNKHNSIWIAILISSIMFGFAHYEWGWMGIVQTTFMGAALMVHETMAQPKKQDYLLVPKSLYGIACRRPNRLITNGKPSNQQSRGPSDGKDAPPDRCGVRKVLKPHGHGIPSDRKTDDARDEY